MSSLTTRNIQEVLILKNLARTASVQINDPQGANYIADGESVVLTNTGAIATTSAVYPAVPFLQVVQRSGSELIVTSRIPGDKVTSYKGVAKGSAATDKEQIYEIGYNGSTGALDVSTGLDFLVNLTFKHDDMQFSEQLQKYTLAASYTNTTQKLLAKELVLNGMTAYINNAVPVTFAMLNSGATVVSTAAMAVTHGSTVVVTTQSLTAGSTIRIGVTGSVLGTDKLTVPVYTVLSAHPTITNGYILEQPYAGPSNSALAIADWGTVPTEGASWGVRITGKALPFVKDFFEVKKVSFTLGLVGFGTAPINKRQEATFGQGDGRKVAEEESFCKGFEGALNRMSIPLPTMQQDAVTTTTTALSITLGDGFVVPSQWYSVLSIGYFSKNDQTVVAGAAMPQVVKLFIVNAAATQVTGSNGVVDVIDTWMNTTPNGFADQLGSL